MSNVQSLLRGDVWLRYGLGLLVIPASGIGRWLLNPVLGDQEPFLLFMPGIMLCAWIGGFGPGILATLLAAGVGTFFWVGPRSLLISRLDEAVHVTVCLFVGVAISAMSYRLKHAREAAESANRAKNQFIAVLSHELRQPLAPVTSALEELQRQPNLSAQTSENIELIRRNISLQTRLIDDLLDVNRIESGKLHVEPAVCDAHQVIHDAMAACRQDLENANLVLQSSLIATMHHVNADPLRLQQVFWNLLRNSIKFTPAGGQISVGTRNNGHHLVVEVRDTGIGIEPEHLSRLFDAFHQAHGELSKQLGGLGLGLSICRGIVRLSGGEIHAASAGKGQGATFTVALPCCEPLAVERPTPQEPTARHSARILLVDDQPETVRLLGRLLQQAGYEVATAGTVRSAMDAASASRFDLLLSDLALPDGSGTDLMRLLRQSGNIKGICLSGLADEDEVRKCLAAGFSRHIAKPVTIPTLCKAIESVLAAR